MEHIDAPQAAAERIDALESERDALRGEGEHICQQ